MMYKRWIQPLVDLMWQASEAVLDIYRTSGDFDVEHKEDDSPLTAADLKSHSVISAGLQKLTPSLPILSEESQQITWDERKKWRRYWLVDPLDGTREFIARNDEFTINIALIEESVATLGLVATPALNRLYLGYPAAGICQLLSSDRPPLNLACRSMYEGLSGRRPVTLVTSRRHGNERLSSLLTGLEKTFSKLEIRSVGSALKLCLLAEGAADFYPRLAPTSEWDIAAAHAVLAAAGGKVLQLDGQPLRYNTKDSLLNPEFLAIADSVYDWCELTRRISGG